MAQVAVVKDSEDLQRIALHWEGRVVLVGEPGEDVGAATTRTGRIIDREVEPRAHSPKHAAVAAEAGQVGDVHRIGDENAIETFRDQKAREAFAASVVRLVAAVNNSVDQIVVAAGIDSMPSYSSVTCNNPACLV